MNTNLELEKLLAELNSDDPMTLVSGLRDCVKPLREFSARAVKAIEDPDYGCFVAEGLYQWLVTIISEVERFQATTTDLEAKVHSSVMLLMLGSKVGVPELLDAVERSTESAGFAARKLANAGVTEVYERIINRLRKQDISNPRVIVFFLTMLRDAQIDLPPDLASELLSADTPDEVREFISAAWPQPAPLFSVEPSSNALRV